MSYELKNTVSLAEDSDKDITVALDNRHTAVLSRKAGKTSLAVFDGKYNDYCTKEVFPEYNQDVITISSNDEALGLVKDMLMIFKR